MGDAIPIFSRFSFQLQVQYLFYWEYTKVKSELNHFEFAVFFSNLHVFYYFTSPEVIYQEVTAHQQSNVSKDYQFIVLWINAASG
jgi:hypothetical protein